MSALSPKQKLFCVEYLKDLNATQAAIRAGYSKKTAAEQASRLLTNVNIKRFIQERMDKRVEKVEVTSALVLGELLKLATADLSKAYGPDGALLHPRDMPEDVRKCISSIDVYKDFTEGVEIGETQKVKFWDKNKSLELLGKHLKLFTDKIESHNSHSLEYARDVSQKPTEELIELAKSLTKKLEGKK